MSEGFDLDVRLDDIIDSQLERVSEARDALTDGLSVLTWIHFVVFPSSWYCFYWLGKMYFERYLGIYHATSSKHWSTLCKLIFLLTFVSACNLLELMLFEILDLLPPALRRLAWSSTFVLLCILLNNIIPFVMAATMGRTLGLKRLLYVMLGVGCVVFVQIWFWVVGETFISDSSETWKDHNSHSVIEFLCNQLLLTDVQHSVALIATMGTGVAAIVAGFATASFPVEQLMVVRGVDLSLLRAKESFHVDLLRTIARRKRDNIWKDEPCVSNSLATEITMNAGIQEVYGERSRNGKVSPLDSHLRYKEMIYNISWRKAFHGTYESFLYLWQSLDITLMKVLQEHPVDLSRRTMRRSRKLQITQLSCESCKGKNQKDSLDYFSNDEVSLMKLEKKSKEIFLDIVHMHELLQQIKSRKTTKGRGLWTFGLLMSFVAILRLTQGVTNVGGYLRNASEEWHVGYIEGERSYFDRVLSLLEFTFRVNFRAYERHLVFHCFYIGALGLMQIRAFLGTMGQLARMGFLSTNTELYALVLAYLSGFYFIASVVLLRTELPLNYRKGVTVALGSFGFDFFGWTFDCIFVVSTTLTVLGLVQSYASRRSNFMLHGNETSS